MNSGVRNLLAGCTILAACASSHAGVIVDTGPGPVAASGTALAGGVQWLAAEFVLGDDSYITRVEGWLAGQDAFGNSYTGKQFTISIWNDGGDQPAYGGGAADLLYSKSASITGVDVANWEGYDITFGNGLELAAGEYWVSFEIRTNNGDDYVGAMPGGALSPLDNEGFLTTVWQSSDDLDLGIRIFGNLVNTVPSPSILMLISLGLAGIGYQRRKQIRWR